MVFHLIPNLHLNQALGSLPSSSEPPTPSPSNTPEAESPPSAPSTSGLSSSSTKASNSSSKKMRPFVVSTSSEEKERLSQQCARMFYKNRLPFQIAEDPEFLKFCEMMRPGLGGKLLSRKDLSGKALTKEHGKIDSEMRLALQVWMLFRLSYIIPKDVCSILQCQRMY